MAKRYIWSRFVLIVFEFNIVDFQWVTDQVDTKNHLFSAKNIIRWWAIYIWQSRFWPARKNFVRPMPFINTGVAPTFERDIESSSKSGHGPGEGLSASPGLRLHRRTAASLDRRSKMSAAAESCPDIIAALVSASRSEMRVDRHVVASALASRLISSTRRRT